MLESHWSVALLAFLLGSAIGSFLNVCIVRWPEGESVVRPRSRCPRCGRPVQALENVP
ncbi:MAG: prepilin peptidase, partial [Gemmatirosa sp.]